MTKKRTIQEIFNLAIEKGYYSEDSMFMCGSVLTMADSGIIEKHEQYKAIAAINKYIKQVKKENGNGCVLLSTALAIRGHPNDFNARLAIYKDWKNKPILNLRTLKKLAKQEQE